MAVHMQQSFSIYPFDPPGDVAALRTEVRAFLAAHEPKLGVPNCWVVGDPEFSRALGVAGFLGMILPREVGGHARHPLERYVVIEELLAAGAPVGLMGGEEKPVAAGQASGSEEGSGAGGTETLYIELRQDGATIDPGPWFVETKDK